jgi:hypothetical protein
MRHLRLVGAEGAVVAVLVGLACAAYLSLVRYGFNKDWGVFLVEETFFAQTARRVLLGALPYRDFSIPYTPGVFYLHARLMEWLGPDLVVLRAAQVACRAVFCLALYAAGRQLLPPAFAALPPALLLGMDTAPPHWDIHPGWYAAPASVITVWALARYIRAGRGRWLIAAGAAAGVGFAFKQNTALLSLMAVLWLLAVAESRLAPVAAPLLPRRRRPGPRPTGPRPTGPRPTGPRPTGPAAAGRLGAQVAALVLLPLAAAVLVRPHLSGAIVGLFVLPPAAVSAVAAVWLLRVTGRATGGGRPPGGEAPALGREASFYARPLLVLAGFAAVTAPWLVPLIAALDGRVELLGPFVGGVDPTGYYSGPPPLKAPHVLLTALLALTPWAVGLLAAGAAAAGRLVRRRVGLPGLAGLGVLAPLLFAPLLVPSLAALAGRGPDPAPGALTERGLDYGLDYARHLLVYLPFLIFWPALLRLLYRLRGAPGPAPATPDLLRLWYLAAGAALLLGQYPRADKDHLPWSATILFVAGADLLYAWYQRLVRREPALRGPVARVALGLSLVLLPAVAVLPMTQARLSLLLALRRGELAPLGLPQAGVYLEADEARPILEAVALVREATAPGEPIFAYPADPGFYYLADRPNPTRFNHLFAGMATPAEQEEVVRQLEAVRCVVWDYPGSLSSVHPGDNAPLTEYIRTHFYVQGVAGPYAVLTRDPAGAVFHYPPPAGS